MKNKTKTTRKTIKKRGKRGSYKKRVPKNVKKVKITFLNLGKHNTRQPGIKIANTCVSVDPDTAKRIGFSANDHVIVGKKGDEVYLTLKPKNVSAGHKLCGSKTGRLTAHIRKTAYKLTPGVYQPGEPVTADMPTEQGSFVEIVAYPLISE
jgi:hypothetical protein